MSVESNLFDALKTLVSNRVYPDVAPQTVARPYITYTQVGGRAIAYLESAVVGLRNGRFQVNVWADSRLAAMNLCRQVEDTLVASTTLRAIPLGAPVSVYEPETKLYGTRQDFSTWF